MDLLQIQRALISVSNKTGITEFARALHQRGVEMLSTGGTYDALTRAQIPVRSVSEVTGFPEILDGRVKTLHPKIHGGLLAVPENKSHAEQMAAHGISPIDLLVVNLYPFEETIARPEATLAEAVEQIDIGGPAMLRAAAKNYRYKAVVVEPPDYGTIISEMDANKGAVTEALRFRLAQTAFEHTAQYDGAIARYLERHSPSSHGEPLPDTFSVSLVKAENLRYGENPHQRAALYGDFHSFFRMLHGKELSYNNIVDIQAAVELAEEFREPAVVIVKHTNPCGVGLGATLAEAYSKAFATDTKSSYGGIVAVNRPLDIEAAQLIDKVFTEVVIAPGYAAEALEFLKKKKDRRLMEQRLPVRSESSLLIKHCAGGLIVQTPDTIDVLPGKLSVVTKRHPTAEEKASMMFAWRVAKHVRSNAIVYARSDRTVGIGAGQMSRVDSSRIAVLKAKDAGLELAGTAVASDAFFPFADGVLEAIRAGATAIIQPGGSVRDAEAIAAADEHDATMMFTGVRHFRH